MKIAGGSLRAFELPLRRPLCTGAGTIWSRTGVLLFLKTDTGNVGVGEASPLPFFGMESLEVARETLEKLLPALRGIHLDHLDEEAWSLLPDADVTPSAAAASVTALGDLAAQAQGMPLASWLVRRRRASAHSESGDTSACSGQRSTSARSEVETHALLTESEPQACAQEACRRIAEGFRALKLKFSVGDAERDFARATAVRAAVGPAVLLRGDANGAWSMQEAKVRLAALAPLVFEYVEQPLPADALEDSAALRARSRVPIAADEAATTPARARRIIELRAADVLIVKPQAAGGFLRADEIVTAARAAGLHVVASHLLESAVGFTAALHWAASWPGEGSISGLGTVECSVDDVAALPVSERGILRLSGKPGLGIGGLRDRFSASQSGSDFS